jgi:asparagine synthase (glutamine-hydrolysing)
MCGVAGFLNLNGKPASEVILKKMTDSIAHRGPNGEGQWLDGVIALGHRRLAILDLSEAGAQPMLDRTGRYVISYNGEIYNFKNLRNELKLLGYSFVTNTDTEVVLASYAKWGTAAIEKFNGMFAFAIWDKLKRELVLARDRYGIKPLYYYLSDKELLFSSENKSFLHHPSYRRTVDKVGLLEYMTFQNFFTDRTLFEGVRILPAGHFAVFREGDMVVRPQQYWDFQFQEPIGKELTIGEYYEELDYLIRQAVSRQLVADVEIGSYLSGGMDSGSITALASQQIPYIKTFTVGFDLNSASGLELGYDERSKAEYMSYLFKTEHYEMVLKSGDMERCLSSLVYHLEEPRVGQSYPNFYAAKLASRFTKVVLSGCGGDEIFGGYPWRYYRSVGHKSFDAYIDEYYLYWQRLIPNRYVNRLFSPIKNEVRGVWTRDIFRDVYRRRDITIERPEDYINHSLYFEAKTFLHGLLTVEDKLSMAHSLETRVPFLDNDLVDFGQRLPISLKLANLSSVPRLDENDVRTKLKKYYETSKDGKILLRQVMEQYIPKEVTERHKQGFSAPDASWFKGESIELVRRKLLGNKSCISNYLDGKVINEIVEEHLEGKTNHRLFIWSLLNLETLLEQLT